MSKLIVATTASKAPGSPWQTKTQTVVIESDKIMVFPENENTTSLIKANGWEFRAAGEVAEFGAAMSAVDASTYT